MGERLVVDAKTVAPPRHMGDRHRDLCPAMSSPPVEHVEHERLITEVEVRLRLDANLGPPYLLGVAKPPLQPVMAMVDRAADRRKRRMKLHVWIAVCDQRLDVACVERFHVTTMEINVLLRHACSPPGVALRREAEVGERAHEVQVLRHGLPSIPRAHRSRDALGSPCCLSLTSCPGRVDGANEFHVLLRHRYSDSPTASRASGLVE